MQKIIEKVIDSKNFELSDMLKKIDTLWVQGSIDEATRKILMDKARNNANVQNSLDVLSKLEEIDKRMKALEELDKRVKALEEASVKNEVETEEPAEPMEPTETSYPAFVVGKWYYAGDRINFEGKNYECIAPENVVCVWSPADYPAYWQELEQPL